MTFLTTTVVLWFVCWFLALVLTVYFEHPMSDVENMQDVCAIIIMFIFAPIYLVAISCIIFSESRLAAMRVDPPIIYVFGCITKCASRVAKLLPGYEKE
jgi:hypothetical protein